MEAIRGEITLSEPGAKHGIHPAVIGGWKRRATEGLAGVFDAGEPAAKTVSKVEVEKLHAKIGSLLVERDFFSEGLRSMSVARRQDLVEPAHHSLSLYEPRPESEATLALMQVIDTVFPDCL